MKFTSIALLALTTLGLVGASGSRLKSRAGAYLRMRVNGQKLESFEKRQSTCPPGYDACPGEIDCCPTGTCIANSTLCNVLCTPTDIFCSGGYCCPNGTICGTDGLCDPNPVVTTA